jgi:pantoate--beta-alanine ligase
MSSAAAAGASSPRVISAVGELRATIRAARAAGKTIGVVPTMGALHAGHVSLVQAARADCGLTVVTIYVNPTQFGPQEDLARYPRTLEADLSACGAAGADVVFVPDDRAIYPAGFSTYVDPPAVAQPLEGQFRPGHFRGVATVVLKLFNLVQPDVAYFGHKDYQQTLVVRRMVQDLDVPVEIRVCPTVREADGLALSSRNRYLSPAERGQAVAVSRSLARAAELVQGGAACPETVAAEMQRLLAAAGFARIDYATLADPQTLQPVCEIRRPIMALVAAYLGHTRLIDNLRIE